MNRLSHWERRKEVRHVEMMLGTVTREMEISTINVEALDGKSEMKVNVTKVDKNELLNVDNLKYEEQRSKIEATNPPNSQGK